MEGEVTIASEEGKGTSAMVELPAATRPLAIAEQASLETGAQKADREVAA